MSANTSIVEQHPGAMAPDATAFATTITEATEALIAQVAAWRAQMSSTTRQIADVASMATTPTDGQPVCP